MGAPEPSFPPPEATGVPLHDFKPKGYPKLAALMGPNLDVAIFRRFSALNMLNLLSLQAELVNLEAQLSDIVQEDDSSDDPKRKFYSERFSILHRSLDDGDGVQWQTQLDIRKKLTEYNSALLQAAQISELKQPADSDLGFLRDWLQRPTMGNNFLRGRERSVWQVENTQDLMTFSNLREEQSLFSVWLRSTVVDVVHHLWGQQTKKWTTPVDREAGIVRYEESAIVMVTNIIGTVLSSLLPILSIVVLYFVKDTLTRLGIVVIFTALFSATLAIFTSARRVEVFASTAAFAAVEVVFIGNTCTPA